MIELRQDTLVFSFPEVHPDATLRVSFQRTLRIPDDDRDYALPPGLGEFPLRHVDDYAQRVPEQWLARGGVMLPMYPSEALWLSFDADWVSGRGVEYPFAIKIGAGKINAVTGGPWSSYLHRRPQDYVVAPTQPWLDGYCVEKGLIRQFVAMPLGAGYTAEEQLTGAAEHGGLQIMAFPMKRQELERRFPRLPEPDRELAYSMDACFSAGEVDSAPDMGLAPGGKMRQEIYDDPYRLRDWDKKNHSRCFVHLTHSLMWRAITGEEPPTTPPTAEEYTRAGLPWFDYYDPDAEALHGSEALAGLKSVATLGKEKGDVPLPDNAPVSPENVVTLRAGLKKNQVREGNF